MGWPSLARNWSTLGCSEHRRHDFLLLAAALAAPDFPAHYSQLGTPVIRLIEQKTGTRNQMTVLRYDFFQHCLGVFQIAGVETFGEPVVDFGEHRARLVVTTL